VWTVENGKHVARAASTSAYGSVGARINVVTPGIVASPMGQALLDGPEGKQVKAMMAVSPIRRIATSGDVAEAIGFFAGPTAAYITGAELVVDGGMAASVLHSQLPWRCFWSLYFVYVSSQ
jgi:NAD(P)-dependent dehydrogenase (short-subunit alcohol dehydrogenase family)